jgi:predicted Rdx family selenoprotein
VDATLTPGEKGIFDVLKDGKLIYSKHQTGRFPNAGEVTALVKGK